MEVLTAVGLPIVLVTIHMYQEILLASASVDQFPKAYDFRY